MSLSGFSDNLLQDARFFKNALLYNFEIFKRSNMLNFGLDAVNICLLFSVFSVAFRFFRSGFGLPGGHSICCVSHVFYQKLRSS